MNKAMAWVATLALLAGCSTTAPSSVGPTASSTASASPSASASPAATASATASPTSSPASPAPSASPEPTSALGPFECDLPVSLAATTNRAQIVDVRVGSHPSANGYDRIVFEFQRAGIPEFTLRAGRPPFTYDPSGLPMDVSGRAFLVMVLHGGTGITPDGVETYRGPDTFTPRFPVLTQLKQAGDFEAVSEWVAGLTGQACHRLFVLRNPSRIVLDLEHP